MYKPGTLVRFEEVGRKWREVAYARVVPKPVVRPENPQAADAWDRDWPWLEECANPARAGWCEPGYLSPATVAEAAAWVMGVQDE